MGNVMAYSGITTKVRAMSAKLLKEKDYDTIAGLGTVTEAIEYLKDKTAYAPYVERMDVSLYHRGNVEKILYQSLFDDYSRIFRFAGMEQKTFLKLYWKRYEVDLINYCLRIVFNHYEKPFDLEYKKEFFDRYSQISIDRLITSKNIDELVDNLRDTEYYGALARIRDSGAGTLFDYDLALDLYYFSTMWKKGKRVLKGHEQKIFLKDYGMKIDLLNLQWIYRAKKYYHMLPPDIYSMTIPIHYRIKVEEFKTLVETPTLEQFEAEVEKTYYAGKYNYMQTDKRTVTEAIEYLKDKTAYAPYVNRMDISLYHRGNVEKILYQSLFDDYSRLFRFAGMKQKTFLKLYWKRYEIDLINYCLRIVFNHYDKPFDLEYKKEFFDRYSQISIDRLITSKNIDELVDNLRDTEYYDALARIKDSGAGTLFDYDLALDLYYFSTMWKKGKRVLKGHEQKIFLKDYGTKIDLLNLQWIYRAKKYYHMLPPDIYSMTIPIHYRVRVEEFKSLVETPTLEQFETEVGKTYYAGKYDYMQADKTLEQMYRDCLRKLYLTDKRNDPYSIAIINTYLFLKEEEIYKLTTALECIRYGLTKGETLGYLGGVNQ